MEVACTAEGILVRVAPWMLWRPERLRKKKHEIGRRIHAACRPFHIVSQGANQDECNEVTIDGEHILADTVHQGHPCQYLSACIPQISESKSEVHRSHAVVFLRMQQGRRTAVDCGRCSSCIMYGVEHFLRDMINIIRIIRRGHDSAYKFLLS